MYKMPLGWIDVLTLRQEATSNLDLISAFVFDEGPDAMHWKWENCAFIPKGTIVVLVQWI